MKPPAPVAKTGFPGETVARYAKFCLVGGAGVVVDMAILYLLLGPHPSVLRLNLCKLLAAETAVLNNFVWNDLWTFQLPQADQNGAVGRLSRFFRFNLISATGLVIAAILLNWQVYGLEINVYLANVISIVIVSVWNFALSSKYGWKLSPEPR